MATIPDDLVRHHLWATATLIDFCASQDTNALETRVAGTYGSAIDTLRHLIDAEMAYLFRLTGAWDDRPWVSGEPVSLDTLANRAAILAEALLAYCAGDPHPERPGGDRGEVFSVPAGLFLAQVFHHANMHRGQVCTQLGAQGIDVPDLSAWDYAIETGRSTVACIIRAISPD